MRETALTHDADGDPLDRCEGCRKVATHYDGDGIPLCDDCWDAIDPTQEQNSND